MTAKVLGALGAILLGVLVNDIWALSTPFAQRVVVIAARLWARDREQAEILAEEWSAHIEDRPGQLLKLSTAAGLLAAGAGRHVARRLKFRPGRFRPTLSFSSWVPSITMRASDVVLVALLVGLWSALAPLIFFVLEVDISWAPISWAIAIAIAGVVTTVACTCGFMVSPPPAIPAAGLGPRRPGTVADLSSAGEGPTIVDMAPLVRPFVRSARAPRLDEPGESRLVRPYVRAD